MTFQYTGERALNGAGNLRQCPLEAATCSVDVFSVIGIIALSAKSGARWRDRKVDDHVIRGLDIGFPFLLRHNQLSLNMMRASSSIHASIAVSPYARRAPIWAHTRSMWFLRYVIFGFIVYCFLLTGGTRHPTRGHAPVNAGLTRLRATELVTYYVVNHQHGAMVACDSSLFHGCFVLRCGMKYLALALSLAAGFAVWAAIPTPSNKDHVEGKRPCPPVCSQQQLYRVE
jgi:hypothetical protein